MHVEVLQTLGDPTRLRIVEILRSGEHSVNHIVEDVDIDQSGVSRHLRILQQAGFVRVRPAGQKRFYSLCPDPFRDLDAWVSRYRQLWDGRLDKLAEALARKRDAKKSGLQTRKSLARKSLNRKSSMTLRREHHERKSE
jgi:DNA-binding transcriptional ArsR family regulator